MQLLCGKEVAAFHREQVERRLAVWQEKNVQPELAIILVGEDKPSAMYAKSMQKVAHSVGLTAEIYHRDTTVSHS